MREVSGMKKLLVVFLVLLSLLCGGALAGTLPESEHPYPENCEDLQTYEYPGGAAYLKIVFSQDTFVETSWDFISLIDAAGTESCYTGDALSGRAIYVEGVERHRVG